MTYIRCLKKKLLVFCFYILWPSLLLYLWSELGTSVIYIPRQSVRGQMEKKYAWRNVANNKWLCVRWRGKKMLGIPNIFSLTSSQPTVFITWVYIKLYPSPLLKEHSNKICAPPFFRFFDSGPARLNIFDFSYKLSSYLNWKLENLTPWDIRP